MISFGIVVFREMLEISLVLGILLAGTTSVPRRTAWIWLGVVAGIMGSVAVALFTEQISEMMEGFGQEVFNASVLIVAAVLIGSTVIWMKRHARQITTHLKQVGEQVSQGSRPLYVLSTIIALTILRDGSEVVLLGQGVMVTAKSSSDLLIGGLVGMVLGAGVGLAIYLGLVRSATRHLFELTSWLLILLCAGMVSQGVGLLASADILPTFVYPLWDTSHILSEQSILGESLHVMIGYCSRPSGMQVFCYVLTLLLIAFAMFRESRMMKLSTSPQMKVAISALLLLGIVCFRPESSLAIDKVYSPIVEEGELELETKGTYAFDGDDSKDGEYKQYFGLGYGFTDRFFAELYAKIVDEPEESLEFESVLAETRYQLFEQGEYFLDAGLYFEYEYETETEKHEMEAKLLLEKSTADWVHGANLVVEREMFAGGGEEWEGAIRWHTLYRLCETLEPGLEIQSELGEFDDMGSFDSQEHYLGPVVHGSISKPLNYELAGLFGVSDDAADFVIRWVLEWEL